VYVVAKFSFGQPRGMSDCISMYFYLLLYRYKSPKDAETFYNTKSSLPYPQGNAVPVAVAPNLYSVAVTPSLNNVASLDSVVINPSLDSVAVQTDALEPSNSLHSTGRKYAFCILIPVCILCTISVCCVSGLS